MVTAPISKDKISLEEFIINPPERMEWVDGQLVEKKGMTLRHGKIQLRLGRYWEDYKDSSG
jgi:Uma2 family endonuclease